ncbi:MAG: hypothetical protein COB85_04100 [Bacteroidetes bacterium]|nr:MAG: hypothetical protein COB85_04100 [Bacteroidota bacterium]
MLGGTVSFGQGMGDIYLVRTDSNGDTLWTRTYGGANDEPWWLIGSVQETSDNGFILTGVTTSFGAGGDDVYLIRTDVNGDNLWTKTYGGINNDGGSSVQQTVDGGYVIAGNTASFGSGGSDVYLIKTNANGDTLWTKTYGSTGNENGLSVRQTKDGGYIITGSITDSISGNNVYLIKTDANGNSGCNESNTNTIVTSPATVVNSTGTQISSGAIILNTATIISSTTTVDSLLCNGVSNCNLTGNASGTNVTCSGGSDGTAIVMSTGGFGSISYNWSSSDTAQNISGLSAGSYVIIITDSVGCTASDTISITEPSLITGSTNATICSGDSILLGGSYQSTTGMYNDTIIATNGCDSVIATSLSVNSQINLSFTTQNAACSDSDNGLATIVATGGSAPYSFLWSSGQMNDTATGLSSGVYSVAVTDSSGCTATDSVTISEPAALSISVSTTYASCGTNNGSAIASVTGGTQPYSYQWSSGDTSVIADSLTSGIYIVTVTDTNGCSAFSSATVSDSAGPTVATMTIGNVTCFGRTDGYIDLGVAAMPPVTFSWTHGANTEDVSNLSAGPYEVVVTDGNGCTSVVDTVITQPSQLALVVTTTAATCDSADGSASLTVTGGMAPYTYSWSSGGTGTTETGLIAGVYVVTITDANGCQNSVSAAVSDAGSAIITIDSVQDADCAGIGSAYVSVSGGTAPYTYNWSNNDTMQDLTGVSAGLYSVTITGADGCEATAGITIDEVQPFENPICLVTVDTITGTNLIVWEKQQTTGIAYYNIYKESNQAGVYYFIGNRPYDSLSFYTDSFSDPLIRSWRYKIAAVDSCGNESALSGEHKTIHLVLSEFGNNVYLIWDDYQGFSFSTYNIHRYSITNGWEVIGSLPNTLHTYTDTAQLPGNRFYFIEAEHPAGCVTGKMANYNSSLSNKDKIVAVSSLAANTTVQNPSSGNCDGSATASATGGVLPYTYLWNTSPVQTSVTADSLCQGTYAVTVTDAIGDTVVVSATVFEIMTASATAMGAIQDSCNGSATANPIGGVQPYTYSWNDPNNQTTQTATGLCANTTVTVTVIDSAGNTTTATVTVPEITGIDQHSNLQSIRIYPNPSRGVFTVEIMNLKSLVKLKVFDILGREILQTKIVDTKTDIDLSGRAPGVYHLKLTTPHTLFNNTVVIER